MKAKIQKIMIPRNKRVICISDIHGSLDLFKELLKKVFFTADDLLILLGDLYTKGKQNHETLQFIMSLSQNPNVYILRGNCDWKQSYLTEEEGAWLEYLPHIIETENYLFVHAGLGSGPLEEQEAVTCMKNDAFMEKGLCFDRYVVCGHWPTVNYTHQIPCFNPIVNQKSRIISIDGGNILKNGGQLNAFIICKNRFTYEAVDSLPLLQVEKAQSASGGELNITWNDRWIDLVEEGEEFGLYRHRETGKTLYLPSREVWRDEKGNLCECDNGTDYQLPVCAGEVVSLVKRFGKKALVKKNGIMGWIDLCSVS